MSPIGPGSAVEVIAGDSAGSRGTIVRRWPKDFTCRLPLRVVQLGEYERVIRADYLRGVT